MKISGVYQIINTITGDFYIGSSVDLERRKQHHFYESYWKYEPNKPLYKDMKQYGKNSFLFKPIWLCDPSELKKYEQVAIDKYKPKYNVKAAYARMTKKEYMKQYRKENADKIRQQQKEYMKQYRKENADKIRQQQKEYMKQYRKENADSIKQYRKENADSIKQYQNQQCLYENELLSLNALRLRLFKQGIEHPTQEAKKYLIKLL